MSDAFRAYLRSLPDDIALAREDGLPVVLDVKQPLPPHAQRLMDSLGVEVRVAVVTPERRALVERVNRMRTTGMLHREISAELGLSRSYVSALAGEDPLGEKAAARKASYRGVCVECGGPTDGALGPKNTPERCAACAAKRQHDDRFWTRESIVASFKLFAQVIGRSPAVADRTASTPSVGATLSPERIAEAARASGRVRLPHYSVVCREFGSWPAALEAAGLTANPTGGAGHRVSRRTTPKGAPMARIYHVLHRNGDGGLHDTKIEAHSAQQAIEKVADSEGEWIAVLDSNWFAASTQRRQVFAVVEADE